MDELPNEILPIVAGYLPPRDAIHLNSTCQKLHTQLSFTATCPRQILTRFIRKDRDDDAHYGFQIPVPEQVTCHSVLLSMLCRDHGWGTLCKGKVFVVAEEENHFEGRSHRQFGDGRVVYTSGIISHDEKRLDITFRPKKNETYHLWYVVGGGVGHSLRLSNVNIQALVFDDAMRCFGKAYNFLTRADAFHAWDQESSDVVHVDTEQFLQSLGDHLLPPLVSFADGCHVSEENLRRNLRQLIKSLRLSWAGEFFEYEKMNRNSGWLAPITLGNLQVDDFLEDRMDFGEFVVSENE